MTNRFLLFSNTNIGNSILTSTQFFKTKIMKIVPKSKFFRRWSKPHPQQSFSAANSAAGSKSTASTMTSRQPLKQTNNRPLEAVIEEKPLIEQPPVVEEWKPCGVLKKPGSYRMANASLKKVAFLENTELNRSTL